MKGRGAAASLRLVLLLLAALLAPGVVLGQAGTDGATTTLDAAAASRSKGADDAPVVVYEIADFQCPYCGRFSRDIFPSLDSTYIGTGKVRWVFINLPLPSHPRAWAAAEAALCAGAAHDNGFWAMHDRLFAAQDEWGTADDPAATLLRYARQANVPVEPYQACVRDDAVATLLLQDVFSASSAGVSGTPTFFINRDESVVGYKTVEEWKEILDEAIRKAEEGGGF